MGRTDAESEVRRCVNALARTQATQVVLVGLSEVAIDGITDLIPDEMLVVVNDQATLELAFPAKHRAMTLPVRSHNNIGAAFLQACHESLDFAFEGRSAPAGRFAVTGSSHLVLCENGSELTQLIAANYSYAINASFESFAKVDDDEAERLLDKFYSIYDPGDASATCRLEVIKQELRSLIDIQSSLDHVKVITFVTCKLPFGFAFNEVPNTHLFAYPHLGRMMANAIAAELFPPEGIESGLLIGAGGVSAREIKPISESLASRSVFIKGLGDPTVYLASRYIELFPYDLLYISTHCGDSSGWRWTYEFADSEGIDRTLVVDVAIEVMVVPGQEKLSVTQYKRFISLDGVDWSDTAAKSDHHIGTAMNDWLEMIRLDALEPTRKETTDRVTWSSALKMGDGSYLAMPRALAGDSNPVTFNNACGSLHRLALSFTYSDARAYIGTLFPVSEIEAVEVASKVFARHVNRPLAIALWRAQREVYGENSTRTPYILYGCHFVSLRSRRKNVPLRLCQKMAAQRASWRKSLATSKDEDAIRHYEDYIQFLTEEIRVIEKYLD